MPGIVQIPGYAEALAKEDTIRLSGFIDIPETISGIEVKAYTPLHMVLVDLARSPYICGHETPIDVVGPVEIAQFLWIVSLNYSPSNRAARDKFIRSIRRSKYVVMHRAICDYIADAFQDSPPHSEKPQKPFTSWCSLLVDLFASEYGWSDEYIMNRPFKLLWQYYRARANRHDPKATHINRSDKVRVDYIAQLNKARQESEKS